MKHRTAQEFFWGMQDLDTEKCKTTNLSCVQNFRQMHGQGHVYSEPCESKPDEVSRWPLFANSPMLTNSVEVTCVWPMFANSPTLANSIEVTCVWPLRANRPMFAILVPVTANKADLVRSCICKGRRTVTGQTLPLSLFSSDFDSFSVSKINVQ